MIIDNIGEIVGGQSIRLDQHVIIQRIAIHLYMAVNHIIKARLAGGGDVLANYVGLARVQLRLNFFFAQVQAMLVVFEGFALRFGLLTRLFQPFGAAEAIIRVAGFHQLLCVGQIHRFALGLHIGTAGAAHIGAFIVRKSGGFQGCVNHIRRAFYLAPLIGILDAQNEFAAVAARPQIGIQRGAQVAKVHIAGRAGGKAGTNFHGD